MTIHSVGWFWNMHRDGPVTVPIRMEPTLLKNLSVRWGLFSKHQFLHVFQVVLKFTHEQTRPAEEHVFIDDIILSWNCIPDCFLIAVGATIEVRWSIVWIREWRLWWHPVCVRILSTAKTTEEMTPSVELSWQWPKLTYFDVKVDGDLDSPKDLLFRNLIIFFDIV